MESRKPACEVCSPRTPFLDRVPERWWYGLLPTATDRPRMEVGRFKWKHLGAAQRGCRRSGDAFRLLDCMPSKGPISETAGFQNSRFRRDDPPAAATDDVIGPRASGLSGFLVRQRAERFRSRQCRVNRRAPGAHVRMSRAGRKGWTWISSRVSAACAALPAACRN